MLAPVSCSCLPELTAKKMDKYLPCSKAEVPQSPLFIKITRFCSQLKADNV